MMGWKWSVVVTWAIAPVGVLALHVQGQNPDLSSRGEPVPLSIGGPAGARVYKPGRWAPVGIEVANPTDEGQVVTATFYFPLAPDVQYARRVFVPAHTRRLATCLVQTPLLESRDANAQQQFRKTFDLHAIVTAGSDSTRVLPGITGELVRNSFLVKHLEHISTAMFPHDSSVPESSSPAAYDAVIALRLSAGLSRRVGEFVRPVFPDSLYDLDALQHIVLHNNVPFEDAATVSALRAWLSRGGRLWIMLDAIDEANVRWLLGAPGAPTVVDRTELTDFQVVSVSEPGTADAQSHEQPVPFVRVVVDGAVVTHTVDGWPAAFWQNYGLGRVLFTTLGPAGWVRRARPGEINRLDPDRQAVFLPRPPLAELATRMLAPVESLPWDTAAWRDYLEQKIGYRIVDGRLVFVFLTVYIVGLAGAGWLAHWRNKTAHLAWGFPAWMVAASVPLAVLGWRSQATVPSTVAEAHHVLLHSDSQTAYARGAQAFYHSTPQELGVEGSAAGLVVPDGSGLEGTLRQLVFDDMHRWRWQNLRAPSGIRMTQLEQAIDLATPFRVEATLGPRGLEGRLTGLPSQPIEDALILMPDGEALSLHVHADGRIWAGAEDALVTGRYIAGSFLTDEQRRRQRLWDRARQLHVHTAYPRRPMLVFWAPPLANNIHFDGERQHLASALYHVGFQLTRPPPGTTVSIPATFLQLVPAAGPTGRGVATSYDPRVRSWVPLSIASDTWLRVVFPPELLPLTVRQLSVEMQVIAPNRPVELLLRKDQQVQVVDRRENPAGLVRYRLQDTEWLQLDEQGGAWLGLRVGEPLERSQRDPEWHVQYFRVSAEAELK